MILAMSPVHHVSQAAANGSRSTKAIGGSRRGGYGRAQQGSQYGQRHHILYRFQA